jgi:hypothetical protein
VEFLAPAGLSTEAEAAPLDLAKLIRQARSTGIKAFLENMSDPRLVQRLAQEAGISLGGTLYVDALSAADGPAPIHRYVPPQRTDDARSDAQEQNCREPLKKPPYLHGWKGDRNVLILHCFPWSCSS